MTRAEPAARRNLVPGAAVALVTAAISGVSVFVNSYGVRAFHQAAVYTTAKNLMAGTTLVTGFGLAARLRPPGRHPLPAPRPGALRGPARWAALAYVGVVGGGAAFVLFFEGLARSSAVPAAFLHDTLVVWVALLAWPVLRERWSLWNGAAIGLLVVGQVVAGGGVGHLVAGPGQMLVLSATVLWAVEVVVSKRLLAGLPAGVVALTRMGGGSAVLVAYLAVTGQLPALLTLRAGQVGWALVTGVLLAGYVATWMVALSRSRALDVTSVLVASALVTALLDALAGHQPTAPAWGGLVLVALGAALVVRAWPGRVAAA